VERPSGGSHTKQGKESLGKEKKKGTTCEMTEKMSYPSIKGNG
jgi:hypothetical protein